MEYFVCKKMNWLASDKHETLEMCVVILKCNVEYVKTYWIAISKRETGVKFWSKSNVESVSEQLY